MLAGNARKIDQLVTAAETKDSDIRGLKAKLAYIQIELTNLAAEAKEQIRQAG